MNAITYMHMHDGDKPEVKFGDTQPTIKVGTNQTNAVIFIERLTEDAAKEFITSGMQAFVDANEWYNERKAHNELE